MNSSIRWEAMQCFNAHAKIALKEKEQLMKYLNYFMIVPCKISYFQKIMKHSINIYIIILSNSFSDNLYYIRNLKLEKLKVYLICLTYC